MKDFDILDRKYTTVSPVQTVLAVLVLLQIIAIALHLNPALSFWYRGHFHAATALAVLWPGLTAGILGALFPLLSVKRGEMSRRALLVTLAIFGSAAVALLLTGGTPGPELLKLPPVNPGSTAWFGLIQRVSFHATLTGYATGFSIGCLLALSSRRMKGNTPEAAKE